jgi:hypothetical protein
VFWPVFSRAGRLVLIVLTIPGVIVVGYTRVALSAHFASDVVGVWCVGIVWVLLLAVVLRVWMSQPDALPARAGQKSTPVSPPGPSRRHRHPRVPAAPRYLDPTARYHPTRSSGRRAGSPDGQRRSICNAEIRVVSCCTGLLT